MALFFHPESGYFISSKAGQTPFGQNFTRWLHWGASNTTSAKIIVDFDVDFKGSPNTDYRIMFSECRAFNSNDPVGLAGDYTAIGDEVSQDNSADQEWSVTTDSQGNFKGKLNNQPGWNTIMYRVSHLVSGTLAESNTNRIANGGPMQMRFHRNTSSPAYVNYPDDGNNAWWDKWKLRNPINGFEQFNDPDVGLLYLATFDSVIRYRLRCTETNGTFLFDNYTDVSLTQAYEVGGNHFTNPPTVSEAPEMTVPVNLYAGAPPLVWSPVSDRECCSPRPTNPFFYSDKIKEDFATAPTDDLQIHTLEIYNDNDPQSETYFLCNDMVDHVLTNEDATQHTYQAANFSFTLPTSDNEGAPEMQISISNIGGVVQNYIERVRDYGPITVKYRVFLASNTSQPQTDNPLRLFLTEVNIDAFQVNGRVSFVDILNKPFPSINYNISNFPNIYS